MKRRENTHFQAIDREKTCPFLLRMFCKENQKHMLEDFIDNKVPEKDELQIYTWSDATLRELSDLVQQQLDQTKKKDTELSFSFIYPDNNGKYRRKDVGTVVVGQRGPDDMKSLNQLRFVIGDYIDLAIYQRREREETKYGGDRDRERNRGGNHDNDYRRGDRRAGNDSLIKQESIGGQSLKDERDRDRDRDRKNDRQNIGRRSRSRDKSGDGRNNNSYRDRPDRYNRDRRDRDRK